MSTGQRMSLASTVGNEMRTSIAILDEGFGNQIIKYMNVNENMEV